MLSRRDLVGKLAFGVAGLATLTASGRARAAVKTRVSRERSGWSDDLIGEDFPGPTEAVQGAPVQKPAAEARQVPTQAVAAPPWELLAPLTQGAAVVYGWRVADLSGPVDGACVLTLENERGRVQRVHLCRNDGQPHGFVYTRRVDLVVMNGGRGDLGTEEHLAQAVAAVAHVVAANEGRADHAAVIDALLPHAERLRQFSAANEWTLR